MPAAPNLPPGSFQASAMRQRARPGAVCTVAGPGPSAAPAGADPSPPGTPKAAFSSSPAAAPAPPKLSAWARARAACLASESPPATPKAAFSSSCYRARTTKRTLPQAEPGAKPPVAALSPPRTQAVATTAASGFDCSMAPTAAAPQDTAPVDRREEEEMRMASKQLAARVVAAALASQDDAVDPPASTEVPSVFNTRIPRRSPRASGSPETSPRTRPATTAASEQQEASTPKGTAHTKCDAVTDVQV